MVNKIKLNIISVEIDRAPKNEYDKCKAEYEDLDWKECMESGYTHMYYVENGGRGYYGEIVHKNNISDKIDMETLSLWLLQCLDDGEEYEISFNGNFVMNHKEEKGVL